MAVFEILKRAFFACLNLVDFATDILVLLRLSCVLDSGKGQPCTGSGSSTCQSHPWWTGIGFVILVLSTIASCIAWVLPEIRKRNRLNFSQRTWRRGLRLAGLTLIAILQLSPFVDLLDMVRDKVDPDQKKAAMKRDLMTKRMESAPQALFQSYIMFSLGSQRELLNVLSIAISISSLSFGLVDYYMQPADEDAGQEKLEHKQDPYITTSRVQGKVGAPQEEMASEEKGVADVRVEIAPGPDLIGSSAEGDVVGGAENDTEVGQKLLLRVNNLHVKLDRPDSPIRMLCIGKLAAFAYLSCDMTLRCIAFAVNFSPSARGPGVAVATVFAVVYILQHPILWRWIAATPSERRERIMQVLTKPRRNHGRNGEHAAEDEGEEQLRARSEFSMSDASDASDAAAADAAAAAAESETSPPPVSPPVSPRVKFFWTCCYMLGGLISVFLGLGLVLFLAALTACLFASSLALLLLGSCLMLVAVSLQTFTASTEVVTNCARNSARRLAALRFVEYACHGVIIATTARTACREPAMLEIQVFFPLLGLNLASYAAYVMLQYKVEKLAECEKAVIEKCSEILSPCLDSLGFMAGSCKACVMNCLYCKCCARTLEKE